MQTLKNRLDVILRSVPEGACVVDVGTDHAFLPIALIKTGRAKRVIACDIAEGPLSNAAENVMKTGAENIELRLSDGLERIEPHEVDTVVIAGMGGDLICDIISRAGWLKSPEKLLLLQPMTSGEQVRKYLYSAGFNIENETALCDSGRVYTVLSARFCGKRKEISGAEAFVGKLYESPTDAAIKYIQHQYRRVSECAKSLRNIPQKRAEFLIWDKAEKELSQILKGCNSKFNSD